MNTPCPITADRDEFRGAMTEREAALVETLSGVRAIRSETFAYRESGYAAGFADAEASMREQINALLARAHTADAGGE